MPKTIKQGKNELTRECLSDIDKLLNHDRFKRMILHHLEVMREHCVRYPLERSVKITLSLKPLVNQAAKAAGQIEYDRAVFSASVGTAVYVGRF
jgi:predicted component of type VI protein secretion system